MIDFSRRVTSNGVLVIKLSGRLDFYTCEYFFNCMQDEIDNGFHRIVVNCRELGQLSSAGVGMLVRARGKVKKTWGIHLPDPLAKWSRGSTAFSSHG